MLPGIHQFDLTGRTALITGGTKGLGRAIAEGLASAGAETIIVSRTAGDCARTASEIAGTYARRSIGVRADVANPSDLENAIAEVERRFDRLDVLVCSAGVNIRGPIDELTYDQFRQVHRTNVDGSWLAARAVTPMMKRQRSGRIIFLSSALGIIGLPGRTPYASSKGAVSLLTKSLALELAPSGVTVNAICPGPFLTEMNQPIADDPEALRTIVGATALNRWGRIEEIQGPAIFLASDASGYVTGSLLSVDGGWTAR